MKDQNRPERSDRFKLVSIEQLNDITSYRGCLDTGALQGLFQVK